MYNIIVVIALCCCIGVLGAPNRLTIIGGHNATKGQFPCLVSIQLCDDGPCFHDFAGVILTESWILTVAHATSDMEFFEYQIYAGITNINDPNRQTRSVEKFILHPNYDGHVRISGADIALVKLSSPLEFNDLIQPAVLPKENAEISVGNATLSGWGASIYDEDDEMYPDNLQTVDVPIVDFKECLDILNDEMEASDIPYYNNSAVCTGPITGGIGACFGDSGGPLIQDDTIIGLVSWGSKSCAQLGSLTVYTKVSSFIPWIADQIDEEIRFQK